MIFSELYSAYYNTVAEIIRCALDHPIEKDEIRAIVNKNAFSESILNIEPAIAQERWQIIKPDGTTNIIEEPTMPLTVIEKRWLNAISRDPRIRLFVDEPLYYPEVEPLFTLEDYTIFDKYSDGDDFEDEEYIKRFRLILDSIKEGFPIKVEIKNRRGRLGKSVLEPKYIEYSEKDDKFRMITASGGTYNLGRIIRCERHEGDYKRERTKGKNVRCEVIFEVYDYRKALERVLLHFAHFEKEAEKIDKDKYKVTVRYMQDDETEIVIRILSFGPMVKVIEPKSFIELIKERLIKQKSCEL